MIRRTLTATAVFLAVLAAVKLAFALIPSQGLLRDDGLFPLWALWGRSTAWRWFLPPLAVGVATIVAAWRGRLDGPGPGAFAAGSILLSAATWTSLALTGGGFPTGLTAPFERGQDYWSAVPQFASMGEVWSAWTARQAGLPLHAATHPPGAVAVLAALSRLCAGDLTAACLVVVLLGTLTILPVYAWARDAAGERAARRAVLLWATAPAVLLYGATCMDMVFAVPLIAAAWMFHRAVSREDAAAAVLSGLALAAGLLCTFAAAVQAIAFLLVAVGTRRFRPLAVTAAAAAAVLLAVRLETGFDWWLCLRQAARLDGAEWPAWSSAGYYVWTRLMGALDPLVMFGAPLAAVWAGTLRRGTAPAVGRVPWGRGTAAACAIVLAAGGFKIGETGRILIFALPAVALPVAALLEDDDRGTALVAAAGLFQAIVFEAVLDTRW